METRVKIPIRGKPILEYSINEIVLSAGIGSFFINFSYNVIAIGPAVAPVKVAHEPIQTPIERAHQAMYEPAGKTIVERIGINKAVEGPAFKKEVHRADRIIINTSFKNKFSPAVVDSK